MTRTASLLLATSLALLVGCGDGSGLDLQPVSGTLKFESGDPVVGARIYFMPEDGGIASQGVTGEDGSFTAKTSTGAAGAVVGMHKVTVSKPSAELNVNWDDPSSVAAYSEQRGAGAGGRSSEPTGARSASDGTVPKIYESPDKTPLSYDVTADGNHDAVEFVISPAQ